MNSEQLHQAETTDQEQNRDDTMQDDPQEGRRAELNPDDFPEAGEPGLDDMPSNANNIPTPEWNPDDFPEG